jgi:hypothetical protein
MQGSSKLWLPHLAFVVHLLLSQTKWFCQARIILPQVKLVTSIVNANHLIWVLSNIIRITKGWILFNKPFTHSFLLQGAFSISISPLKLVTQVPLQPLYLFIFCWPHPSNGNYLFYIEVSVRSNILGTASCKMERDDYKYMFSISEEFWPYLVVKNNKSRQSPQTYLISCGYLFSFSRNETIGFSNKNIF